MNANDLYLSLKDKFKTVYFGSHDELNLILDNPRLPCVLVVPLFSAQMAYRNDEFTSSETVLLAYMQEMYIDAETIDIYNMNYEGTKLLLQAIHDSMNDISSIRPVPELNKYDSGLLMSAIELVIVNKIEGGCE